MEQAERALIRRGEPVAAAELVRGAGLCPRPGRPSPDSRVSAPIGHPVLGEWLALGFVQPDVRQLPPLARVEDVTRAVRGAMLRHALDPPPALLSGHSADGSRLERPHTAFLALPDLRASATHARIAGVAIGLPRDVDPESHQAILLAAAHWERSGLRLLLGRLGALRLARADHSEPESPLDPTTWTRPARRWASVTPVALPKNPGDLTARDPIIAARATARAQQIVADACAQVGLPRPVRVRVAPRPVFSAVPPAPAFMPYPRLGSGFKRVCVHVELEWEEEIAGPVVIGVGRYFGVGLLGSVDAVQRITGSCLG